jgi:hypothetical protein
MLSSTFIRRFWCTLLDVATGAALQTLDGHTDDISAEAYGTSLTPIFSNSRTAFPYPSDGAACIVLLYPPSGAFTSAPLLEKQLHDALCSVFAVLATP